MSERIAAALFACVVATAVPAQIMPDFRDEVASYQALLDSSDPVARLRAAKGLLERARATFPTFGRASERDLDKAVATLHRAIREGDAAMRLDAAATLMRVGRDNVTSRRVVVEALYGDSTDHRVSAAEALLGRDLRVVGAHRALGDALRIGPDALRLQAVHILRNRDDRRDRGETLAIPVLERALGDASADVRAVAATTLLAVGENGPRYDATRRSAALAVAKTLLDAAPDRVKSLAVGAVTGLYGGRLPSDVIPFLNAVLERDPTPRERWRRQAAIAALGRTPPGTGAERVLVDLLERATVADGIAIVRALVEVHPPTDAAWPHTERAAEAVHAGLASADSADVEGATRAMHALGPAAVRFVPVLTARLAPLVEGEDHLVGDPAIVTLARIGPAADEALPTLRALATTGNRDAMLAVARIAPDDAAPWIRRWLLAVPAADLMMPSDLARTIPPAQLLAHTTDADPDVRSTAFAAIGELDPPAKRTVVAAAIARGLRDEHERVRAAAAALDGALGEEKRQ